LDRGSTPLASTPLNAHKKLWAFLLFHILFTIVEILSDTLQTLSSGIILISALIISIILNLGITWKIYKKGKIK